MSSMDILLSRFSINREQAKIAQNLAWLLADKGVAILNGLLVGAYVARYLEPTLYGLFAYGFALAAMALPLVQMGLDKVLVRDYLRDSSSRASTLWTVFLTRLALSLGIYALLLVVLQLGWLGTMLPAERRTLAILLLCVPINSLSISLIPLEAEVLSKYAVWFRNAALLLSALAKVLLVSAGASVEAFAVTFVLTDLIAAAAIFIFGIHRGLFPRPAPFHWNRLTGLMRESWPLLISALCVNLYMNLDIAMLRHMQDQSTAGIYSVAVYLTSFWMFLPMALGSSFFPSLIARQANETGGYLGYLFQLFKLNTLTSYLCILTSLLAFPICIRLLYGEDYSGAVSILLIHVWCLPFVFLGVLRSQHLIAGGLQRLTMLFTLSGLLVNVGLNLLLIPQLGGHGAAVATVISYAVAAFLSSFLVSDTRALGRMQFRALIAPLPLRSSS